MNRDINVVLISCNHEHTEVLEKIKDKYICSRVKIIELPQTFKYKYLNFKKKSHPSVNAMLKKAKKYIKNADILVTTSHGLGTMATKYKITDPKLVIMKHGCGDRAYSFDPVFGEFDLVLVGGHYHRNIMLDKKITSEKQVKVIGYPKFDVPVKVEDIKNKLFNNDNPIVLYNPHWQPRFSSYKSYSKYIIEFFQKNKQYNLIFAPHILLKHWKTHYKYDLNFSEHESDNIHIDFGSPYSSDNSYIKISDIYIGDVSSLVYEFVSLKPRPCIFLNAHNANWKDNLYYRFWEMGTVVNSKSEFEEAFNAALTKNPFAQLQKDRIPEYMDISDTPASIRAASAITELLHSEKS